MSERVLVTGGTGYIAGHCIVQLLQQGFEVRTTVRSADKQAGVRAAVVAAGAPDARLSFHAADLTDDAGWAEAMAGCDYVLHVASPLGAQQPGADADAFVAPARDGTLRVLRAATAAGVKRVVMTSAAAAARPPQGSDVVSDETVWSDPDDASFDAYRRSKILAERAAWDFMQSHGGATEFTTILPAAVFGPVLSQGNLGSVTIVQRMLQGRPGGIPRLGFWVVDVRDLAALHIRAMSAPQAAGQRYIASGDFMWMQDMARSLRSALGERARRVPTRNLPDVVVRLFALFMPHLKLVTPLLGRKFELSSAKARRELGFSPRPAEATVIDCARSLLGDAVDTRGR